MEGVASESERDREGERTMLTPFAVAERPVSALECVGDDVTASRVRAPAAGRVLSRDSVGR
jgi:hypothetical protein